MSRLVFWSLGALMGIALLVMLAFGWLLVFLAAFVFYGVRLARGKKPPARSDLLPPAGSAGYGPVAQSRFSDRR